MCIWYEYVYIWCKWHQQITVLYWKYNYELFAFGTKRNGPKQTICFCGKFLNFPAFSYDGSNPPGGSFILQKNSGFFWRFVKRVLVWLLLFSGLLLLGDVSEVLRFLSQVGRVLAGSGSLLVLVEEAKDSCCPAPIWMFSQHWCVFDINICVFDVNNCVILEI